MQWDNFAKEYDEQVGERGDFYHRTYLNPLVLDILGDVKQKKILDLACGQGYFSRILARKGAQVVGIDLSEKLIKIARESERELDINYFVLNSADLRGIQDQRFDYVVANMALHDISDLKGTISEVGRVIKKGGKFVFSIVHPMGDQAEVSQDEHGYFKRLRKYKSRSSKRRPGAGNTEFFHRSVGDYLQELFRCGFLVSDFHEIVTPKNFDGEFYQDKAKLRFKKEVPLFLVVEAVGQF